MIPKVSNRFSWKNLSINIKINIIIIGIVTVVVAVLIIFNNVSISANTNKLIGEELTLLGSDIISRAAESVENRVNELRVFALSPIIIQQVEQANLENANLTTEEIDELDSKWQNNTEHIDEFQNQILNNKTSNYIRSFMNEFPDEVEVFLTDRRGLNIAMSNLTSDYLQSDEIWWQDTWNNGNGKPFIDKVDFEESVGSYAINIATPIHNEQGDTIGILRGTVDISIVIDTLSQVKIGNTGDALLIDSNGLMLYAKHPEHLMQPAPENFLEFLTMEEEWTANIEGLHGDSVIVGKSSLSGEIGDALGWNLLLFQDMEEIREIIYSNLLQSLIIGFIVTLVFIMISLLFSKSISNSIIDFSKLINQLLNKSNENELLFQSLFENSAVAMALLKPDGRFLRVNEAYSRLTGYSFTELKNLRYQEATLHHFKILEHQIEKLVQGESDVLNCDYDFVRKDQSVFTGRETISATKNEEGKIVNFLLIIQDITEKTQLQQRQIVLLKELEQKNIELDQNINTAAHDLKNPIISIMGYLGFLEKDVENSDHEAFYTDLQELKTTVNEMNERLDNIINLSKVSYLPTPPTKINIRDIMNEIIREFSTNIQDFEKINFEIMDNLPDIFGNENQIKLVFKNLFHNAIKYSIHKENPEIKLGNLPHKNPELFYIQDNGTGIDPRYHERIFRIFEKLDNNDPGSGVGLTITRRIIEAHNGKIWVESTGQEKGSTFYFTLPLDNNKEKF